MAFNRHKKQKRSQERFLVVEFASKSTYTLGVGAEAHAQQFFNSVQIASHRSLADGLHILFLTNSSHTWGTR